MVENASSRADTAPLHVLHLIHTTAFGGVESSAENLRRTLEAPSAGTRPRYRIAALAAAPERLQAVRAHVVGSGVNSPLSALRMLREVRASRPDVLVTSLWRAVALGAAARMLRVSRRTRWAIWVHLPRYTNPLDRLVHTWCLPRADAVICDSEATAAQLVRPALARSGRGVPVHIVQPAAVALNGSSSSSVRDAPRPDEPLRLAFWGRLARQKRLDLVVGLLARVREIRDAGAELTLIGPDAGERAALDQQIRDAGLGDSVHFLDPMDREQLSEEIARTHVFVQLSDSEGFAMSAHEALASGLVCVLTPVGQLAADTSDGQDCIQHHGDLDTTARRLVDLAAAPESFRAMGERARTAGAADAVSEFVEACKVIAGRADGGTPAEDRPSHDRAVL